MRAHGCALATLGGVVSFFQGPDDSATLSGLPTISLEIPLGFKANPGLILANAFSVTRLLARLLRQFLIYEARS
jgi:hypothetical protein